MSAQGACVLPHSQSSLGLLCFQAFGGVRFCSGAVDRNLLVGSLRGPPSAAAFCSRLGEIDLRRSSTLGSRFGCRGRGELDIRGSGASRLILQRSSCAFFPDQISTASPQSQATEMSKSGKGLDWADQWDPSYDHTKSTNNSQKASSKTTSKEKMAKAKAAASVGMQRTKVYATIGIQKTKVGATAGFKWIKAKVQKKPQ